ncbi:MAG TPA: PSD1 and planctomycete cytochrome C domain-containing protein [Prosthecobacter sp.]|nr:PSD1 and planctomycete cytochrome C domain-containing protein [Prosthecobacter sp.]
MKPSPTASLLAGLALLPGFAIDSAQAQEERSTPEGTAFFESKIRPVLVKSCYECHSTESGKSKGGLLLDTRHGVQTGGDTGPAMVPGDPGKSLLLTAIAHKDPDLEMPPSKPKLAAAVIADFEHWIKMGAPDPREAAAGASAARPPVDLEADRQFWAYQKPLRQPAPPNQDSDWARGDTDRYVRAELEKAKLAPAPDAAPEVLLRRLYFDLIGLPPTPRQTAAFAQAAATGLEAALAQTVNDLLGSPEFGVRWGRHWLDVARFAESNGRESNLVFPHAWRYRDYVIDAVNEDTPFDRFITEQLAGDLLPAKNDAERARLLTATGFLAFGAKGLNEMNKQQFAADLADEQLDTVTRAITASSVACARCHDHKTEPFAMEDYYALAGIFKSTKTFYGTWIDSENNNDSDLIRLPDLPGQLIPNESMPVERVAKLKADRKKLDQEQREQKRISMAAAAEGKDLSADFFKMLSTALRIYWSRGGIDGQLETVDETGRALPLCMGVMDEGRVQDSQLYERGEIAHPVKPIARGFPRVFEVKDAPAPAKEQSGRLELARWLTSREHPLTARVMANRVWHHLLGRGLVRTTDNFGFSGERPSHPALLDHLALRFMEDGWSVKALIREIVLSRTYRQASTYRADCFAQDPDNRLLWRAHKRRLDAEVIRDSMLAVSGQLDTSRRPGSLVAELTGQSVSMVAFNKALPGDLDGMRRRSIYLPVLRDQLPDVLELFDFAEPSLVTGNRDVTNVPVQALYLMNGPFVQGQAAALAQRLVKERPTEPERIRRAFQLCFNRLPEPAEVELATQFFAAARSQSEAAPDDTALLTSYCQSLLATAEFRHAD